MPRYGGVHIDIGGVLRVSDLEMFAAEEKAYKEIFGSGLDFLSPMDAWQLYGIFSSRGYKGFMEAATAIQRSGRSFQEFLSDQNPLVSLNAAIEGHVSPEESGKIEEAATRAKVYYNANQSKRLAQRAKEGLTLLQKNKIDLSVITSIETPNAIRSIREIGLSEYFREDLIMGNSPEGAVKKDEKAQNLILASGKMELHSADTLYVADAKGDMEASSEAGCSIAIIRNGMTPPALFRLYLEEMPQFRPGENYFEVKDLFDAAVRLVANTL